MIEHIAFPEFGERARTNAQTLAQPQRGTKTQTRFILDDLRTRAAAWNVTIDEIRETQGSLLAFGTRGASRVVLKLIKQHGDESNSGAVLKAFTGNGTVRVLEYEIGAVLLERIDPGKQLTSLVKQGEDEAATEILADVVHKLANHTPPSGCPTAADWGLGFDRYLETGDRQIPQNLVDEAHALYQHLAASQRNPMLLHGDLQHYNVLFDHDRGWVAIDPKGVVGELEYEIGPILRNPVEQSELFLQPTTIERRLEILTSTLNLDYARVLRWSFAQAVLSAIWDVEDGYPVTPTNPTILLAEMLKMMWDRD